MEKKSLAKSGTFFILRAKVLVRELNAFCRKITYKEIQG